jgi:hypothetical protein
MLNIIFLWGRGGWVKPVAHRVPYFNLIIAWRTSPYFLFAVALLFGQSCIRTVTYLCSLTTSLKISVADPDPGSGAFLTPGSGRRDG